MAVHTRAIQRPDTTGATQTLAAEPLNLRSKADAEKLSLALVKDRVTGQAPWNHFERIGEIHFALTRASRIAGYTKLKAVRYAPDRSEIETDLDSGPVVNIVNRIYSRVGGLRGLMERFFIHMKVPAESHLIRYMDGKDQDGYQFVSSRELHDNRDPATGAIIEARGRAASLKWTTMPGYGGIAATTRTVSQKDYMGRVWVPGGQYLDLPESPLKALDTQCLLLDEMTQSMRATMRSRFATSGFLYFSDKVRDAIGGRQKKGPNDSVLDVVFNIMKENTVASQDVMAVIPILMMGAAEPGKVMEHITLDREIFETDIKLRAELIDRILFGLDISAQATKGNTDMNHWGSWSSNADELRLAVIPDVQAACWAFERLILIPELQESGMDNADIMRYGITFDLSEASVRANREEGARQLRDRGSLSRLKLAESHGFTEADLIDGEEYIRWFGEYTKDPYLATYGMPEAAGIDWEKVSNRPAGQQQENFGETPSEGPGVGDPGSPDPSDSESDSPKPEI